MPSAILGYSNFFPGPKVVLGKDPCIILSLDNFQIYPVTKKYIFLKSTVAQTKPNQIDIIKHTTDMSQQMMQREHNMSNTPALH